ncbi:hypothetical protein ACWET9_31055 [Streptomyces sp. NPDC004059]
MTGSCDPGRTHRGILARRGRADHYTPLVVGGTLLALGLAWELRMKNSCTGPRSTVDLPAEVPAR